MTHLRLLTLFTAVALMASACSADEGPRDGNTAEPPTGTVTVLAAASLTGTFAEIAGDFEADRPGVDVQLSYSASSTIVQQVNGGAPADVIALAGTSSLEPLEAELRVGEETIFTTNSLELAAPPDNPGKVQGLDDLTRPGLTVIVCAAQVPCGSAAEKLFAEQGLQPRIASYEPDVRATLTKVGLGEADVGVVYRTDVTSAGERVEGIPIPADRNVVNRYPIQAVSDSALGQEFIADVLSPRGQAHLTNAGFVAEGR